MIEQCTLVLYFTLPKTISQNQLYLEECNDNRKSVKLVALKLELHLVIIKQYHFLPGRILQGNCVYG